MDASSESLLKSVDEVEGGTTVKPEVRSRSRRVFSKLAAWVNWLFGFASILVGVALLSVIPILNFTSFGYLLEASGRVARTGKLRAGFIGVQKASVLGSAVIGTWLCLFPLRFVASVWRDAELLSPGSDNAAGWRAGLMLVTMLTVWHVSWALIRGGRIRYFFWPAPIRFFRWLNEAHEPKEQIDKMLDYCRSLNLPHYFKIGAMAFGGAVAFLLLPVSILILASNLPPAGAGFFSLLGAAILFPVVLYLPFLQARFAVDGRFRALFEVREVRRLFRRSPIAFVISLFVTLLFALPLYLLKIELPPKELTWLLSLLFVAFIFPARLLTGWALGRALKREREGFFLFRWSSRMASVVVAGFYILFLYLTQYLSWNGSLSLLEQHAFMVPTPLVGL
ncbi:hypothetical protein N9B94_02865 [Verrucomicrobia bacterium]|nr:hypothetical protein [Verrucomicrobiota bacterium]